MTRGAKRKRERKPGPTEGTSVRATISFPSELYKTLEGIAREKKVSLAWVVREASEQYIVDKWPLFGKGLIGGEKQ
ncbi:MAG TPA: CopG family transcriptional regulator [Verrucomicrobiae bacterium]|nr:CopG family transcriptional regulator [Verrucomicrobiae bacterium]